jgi:hypothetical protein
LVYSRLAVYILHRTRSLHSNTSNTYSCDIYSFHTHSFQAAILLAQYPHLHHLQLNTYSSIPTAQYLQLNTYSSIPTAQYLQLNTYSSIPTAHHERPTHTKQQHPEHIVSPHIHISTDYLLTNPSTEFFPVGDLHTWDGDDDAPPTSTYIIPTTQLAKYAPYFTRPPGTHLDSATLFVKPAVVSAFALWLCKREAEDAGAIGHWEWDDLSELER